MKALVLNVLHQPLELQEISIPVPRAGEVLVRLHAAALNHRDVYITQGLYAGIQTPCILGSDGAGELDGKPVVIYPAL
ncbi:MAG: alcohol dehydrogenase catalytic domain-containing protein [Saprospiraceae bacterium]